MCVVTGFIGEDGAAKQLIELTRIQEIVFGGFYSHLSMNFRMEMNAEMSMRAVRRVSLVALA